MIPFTTDEIKSCTNEAAKDANTASRYPPSCCFISCFTVTPSVNTPESSSDFMMLISFTSSFEMNKVNPFPALTTSAPLVTIAPFPLILLSNLFIAFEAAFEATNLGKLFFCQRNSNVCITVLPKLHTILPNQEPRNPPDSINLDI